MICTKIYKVLTAVMAAVVMAGCTADEYLNDITAKESEQQEQQDTSKGTLSDNVSEALAAVEGISDVTVEEEERLDGGMERFYYFYVEQPVSHHDKSLGTYKQYACLRTKDLTAPVLLYTHGYNMSTKSIDDIATYLNASELHVEHRYFGNSLPEPYETLNFTYLNADEAAHDLDSLLVKLQRTVLKDASQWVSTGTSKDGITTALLAYYADKYGWNQASRKDYFKMDLYMPFCAPFLVGTPESCNDPQMGYYLYRDCGSGYPQGSVEEKAWQRLRKIPEAIVLDKDLRESCLRMYHQVNPTDYVEVINSFGRDQEKVSAALLSTYFWLLFGKFSYVPFSEWAHLVPDVDAATMDAVTEEEAATKAEAIAALTDFVFMNNEGIERELAPHAYTDSEILTHLYSDVMYPYDIQAVKELGNVRLDFSMLDGIKFSNESTENMGYLASSISKQFEISTTLARYADQWDGGQLMSSFRSWAATQTAAKMIFVYQANDPWTGGAIGQRDDNYVKRFIFKNGAHNDYILTPRYFPEADVTMLKNAMAAFLF